MRTVGSGGAAIAESSQQGNDGGNVIKSETVLVMEIIPALSDNRKYSPGGRKGGMKGGRKGGMEEGKE